VVLGIPAAVWYSNDLYAKTVKVEPQPDGADGVHTSSVVKAATDDTDSFGEHSAEEGRSIFDPETREVMKKRSLNSQKNQQPL